MDFLRKAFRKERRISTEIIPYGIPVDDNVCLIVHEQKCVIEAERSMFNQYRTTSDMSGTPVAQEPPRDRLPANQAAAQRETPEDQPKPALAPLPASLLTGGLQKLKAMVELFNELDVNGDGQIDKDELKVFFDRLGTSVTTDFVEGIMSTVDKNGNGVLEFNEFVEFVNKFLG